MALLNLDFRNMDLGFTFLLTFHYGAIKPLSKFLNLTRSAILTFHYGAIEPPLALKPLYI